MHRFGPAPPPEDLPALPDQPAGVPWPTDAWPVADLADDVDAAVARGALERFFDEGRVAELGRTHALLVVHRGGVALERYADEYDATSTLPSWSMAKSMLMVFIGMLVGDGKLDVHAPAAPAEWAGEGDPRAGITVDQLLRMSSGLRFAEVYDDAGRSDTIEMLFRSGKEDVAGYAARQPLEAEPDTVWSYSSGTSNILARLTGEALGARGDAYQGVLRRRLFDPIGMRSAAPRLDASGVWIGSSYCFATARDFARFGLLCLRDGCWDGERLVPEGWIDYARTPTAVSKGEYGAHFWLALDGSGVFSANGFRSQYVIMVPDRDVVVVRLGDSETDHKGALFRLLRDLIDAFPTLD